MKALTIWQPWASLIIAGAKPFEFRSWRAPRSLIGQRIVIHAASRKLVRSEVGDLFCRLAMRGKSSAHTLAAAETCLRRDEALKVLNAALQGDLPIAAGLGTAILGEPRDGLDVAAEFGVPRANDSARDEHANWGWPMLEIEAWPEPIRARGAQGFWPWPTPESHLLFQEDANG